MITNILLGLIFIFSYSAFKRHDLVVRFCHSPYDELNRHEYIRLLTSGFLHGSWNHLLINLFVLYQFGGFVESFFITRFPHFTGILITISFYLTAIIVSNLGTLIRHRDNRHFRSLGASGVTSAAVLIYIMSNPWQMFLFPPIPAILFGVLYLGYSTWAAGRHRDHIDHQAHLWGSLYGILFIVIVEPSILRLFFDRLEQIPFFG